MPELRQLDIATPMQNYFSLRRQKKLDEQVQSQNALTESRTVEDRSIAAEDRTRRQGFETEDRAYNKRLRGLTQDKAITDVAQGLLMQINPDAPDFQDQVFAAMDQFTSVLENAGYEPEFIRQYAENSFRAGMADPENVRNMQTQMNQPGGARPQTAADIGTGQPVDPSQTGNALAPQPLATQNALVRGGPGAVDAQQPDTMDPMRKRVKQARITGGIDEKPAKLTGEASNLSIILGRTPTFDEWKNFKTETGRASTLPAAAQMVDYLVEAKIFDTKKEAYKSVKLSKSDPAELIYKMVSGAEKAQAAAYIEPGDEGYKDRETLISEAKQMVMDIRSAPDKPTKKDKTYKHTATGPNGEKVGYDEKTKAWVTIL